MLAPTVSPDLGFMLSATYDESHYTVKGPLALTIMAFISLSSVIAVFIAIIVTGCRTQHEFLRSSVGPFFISLLLSDFLQAIGSSMNLRWMVIQRVDEGSFCTAQAGLKQTGNVGTALWSMVIAIQTFMLLFIRRPLPRRVRFIILACVWLFQGFIVMLGPVIVQKARNRGPFWGVSGPWCWIKNAYHIEQLTNEYLYMFLTVLVSFILYTLIFLRLRGNIRGYNWTLRFGKAEHPWETDAEEDGNDDMKEMSKVGKQVLWYPIAYTIIILPIAICRWSIIFKHNVPYWALMLADSIFMLSGFVNAILYTTTTRKIISLPYRSAFSRLLLSRSNDDNKNSGIFSSKTSLPHMDFAARPSSNAEWEDFQRRRSLFYNLNTAQDQPQAMIQSRPLPAPRKASEFPPGMRNQILDVAVRHDGGLGEFATSAARPHQPALAPPAYVSAITQTHYQRRQLDLRSEPLSNRSSIAHPFANPQAYVSPRRSPILPLIPLGPSHHPAFPPASPVAGPSSPRSPHSQAGTTPEPGSSIAFTTPTPSNYPDSASISPRLSSLNSDSDSSFACNSDTPSPSVAPSPIPKRKRLSALGFPSTLGGESIPPPREQNRLSISLRSLSNVGGEPASWSTTSDLESMRFATPSPEQLKKLRASAGGALELIGGYDSTPFPCQEAMKRL